MLSRRRILLTATGLAFSLAVGHAVAEPSRPDIAVPMTRRVPGLQAKLDDPAWMAAAEITGLTASIGDKTPRPALQPTSVRLMWDEQFLYVRFVCQDDDILATLSGRDAEYDREDVVEVFLDPVGDGKEYVELQVSPNNGVRDVIYLCTGEPAYDANGLQTAELLDRDVWSFPEWTLDGLRTAAARFDEHGRAGWIAELAIPAICLRRTGQKEFEPMTLRANFIRLDHPKDAAVPGGRAFVSTNWSPVIQGRPHRSPGANGYLKLVDHAPR